MNCPHCKERILDTEIAHYLAAKGGSVKSERKRIASRENGKKHKAQVVSADKEMSDALKQDGLIDLSTITIDNQ
jgi:hypothetical protein